MTAVAVMAKAPVPGRSKTRLCPPCTFEEAARLAEAALADTLEAVLGSSARRRVLVLDGEPGPWLPRGFEVIPQRGDTLDARLAAAVADIASAILIVGMDTPQVTSADLDAAVSTLWRPGVDAVLGPAEDGGWWAAGLRDADPRAFLGVPMSTPTTGRAQRGRLTALGLHVADLPPARDVDRFDDAVAVAEAAPDTRFAMAVRTALAPRGEPDVRMCSRDGRTLPIDVGRWLAAPGPADLAVLDRTAGPVLDVGCGPGRHVQALAERGRIALGIDASPAAVRVAHSRGVPVLERSVFEHVPGAGRWGTALALDGSIGIGGDPGHLLRRLRGLLRPQGRILAEVAEPGEVSRTLQVRLESDEGTSPWFPWAVVGADDVARVAAASGLRTLERWHDDGRWFACLAA